MTRFSKPLPMCSRCGVWVDLRWYHRWWRPLCGGSTDAVEECLWRAEVWKGEPPPEDYDWTDDPPPDDIDRCDHCGGSGEIYVRQDWETGALHFNPCGWCGETGIVPPAGWDPSKGWWVVA